MADKEKRKGNKNGKRYFKPEFVTVQGVQDTRLHNLWNLCVAVKLSARK